MWLFDIALIKGIPPTIFALSAPAFFQATDIQNLYRTSILQNDKNRNNNLSSSAAVKHFPAAFPCNESRRFPVHGQLLRHHKILNIADYSKISQFSKSILSDQNVITFEVTMHDLVFDVQIIQTKSCLMKSFPLHETVVLSRNIILQYVA